MANLATNFIGIKSPNPFWLASAPPTDKEYNVRRAFEAGWGGVVWKTLGSEGPPVVNVNGPRYGVIYGADRRVLGINNIELITDRPLDALGGCLAVLHRRDREVLAARHAVAAGPDARQRRATLLVHPDAAGLQRDRLRAAVDMGRDEGLADRL